MRALLGLAGITVCCLALVTIALLSQHRSPASAGFCLGDITFFRNMQVWYGTVSGPGVDQDAVELTDNIVENLRQKIVGDSSVDQRVKDDGLASWVEAGTGTGWALGAPDNYGAENALRAALEAAAPPNGTVVFGTPNPAYYHSYVLDSIFFGCTVPPYGYFYNYSANVGYFSLDATFTSYTPSPSPSPSPTPSPTASPTPTPTPTPTASASPTATVTPTPTPTASPSPSPAHGPQIMGDADCDGDVDLEDVIALLRDAAELPNETACGQPASGHPPKTRDVDCDGSVTPVDALDVMLHLAALPEPPLPADCPDVGQPL